MRGARFRVLEIGGVLRIIPAYAGSTADSEDGGDDGWDHPRVCGEHAYRMA